MSAEALRTAVVDEIERLNEAAMNHACSIRPSHQSTADGLAMFVVDNLAMARAFAQCVGIINREYKKLVTPPPDPATDKPRTEELY